MTGYDLDSKPPLWVVISHSVQHVGLASVTLLFPLLVAEAAGADDALKAQYVSISMVALGISTLLQLWGRHGIGSGYLIPSVFTAFYLPSAILTAQAVGLGAVAGMTMVAGLTEIAIASRIKQLRRYLPTEVAGLVIVIVGFTLGMLALRLMFVHEEASGAGADGHVAVAIATLALTVALSIWGTPKIRILAVVFGMIGGSALCAVALALTVSSPSEPLRDAQVGLLSWPLATPSIAAGFLPGFLLGCVGSFIRASGDIVTSQRANDPSWKRPDFDNVRRGGIADGLGTFIAGCLGVLGTNTFSGSIGLAIASKINARRVGIGTGVLWILLGLIPGTGQVLAMIPKGVLGAALLYSAAFIFIAGVTIIARQALDNRRTIVVGLGFVIGVAYDVLPDVVRDIAPILPVFAPSALALSILVAIGLNFLFSIGRARTTTMRWPTVEGHGALLEMLSEVATRWGARRDVLERAEKAVEEFAILAAEAVHSNDARILMKTDETNLDITFQWSGTRLDEIRGEEIEVYPDQSVSMGSVALALMRHAADDLRVGTTREGLQEVRLRFEL